MVPGDFVVCKLKNELDVIVMSSDGDQCWLLTDSVSFFGLRLINGHSHLHKNDAVAWRHE